MELVRRRPVEKSNLLHKDYDEERNGKENKECGTTRKRPVTFNSALRPTHPGPKSTDPRPPGASACVGARSRVGAWPCGRAVASHTYTGVSNDNT